MNEKPALTLSFTNEHVSAHCSQADIIVVVCNHFFFSNAVNLVNVRQIFAVNMRNSLLLLQLCCRCCSSCCSFWRLYVRRLHANEFYSSFLYKGKVHGKYGSISSLLGESKMIRDSLFFKWTKCGTSSASTIASWLIRPFKLIFHISVSWTLDFAVKWTIC